MRVAIIHNKEALSLEVAAKLRDLLQKANYQLDQEDPELVITVGGDGTIHQVVNELYRLNKQIPIAYIPAGSGNDFARGLGLTREPITIMKQIIQNNQPHECSVIYYNEGIYQEEGLALNNIGIGLDAAIVYETNHSKIKGLLQKFNLHSFSYLSSVVKTLLKQRPFPILVEVNGKQYSYPKAYII